MDRHPKRRPAPPATVLIASDAPSFVEAAAGLVSACGLSAAVAANWEAAWLSVTRTHPSVVLCDCDGISPRVRAIVAEAVARGLPLLLAHPRASLHATRAPAPAGAQRVGWLAVPVALADLRAALATLLAPVPRALTLVPRRVVPLARRTAERAPDDDDRA